MNDPRLTSAVLSVIDASSDAERLKTILAVAGHAPNLPTWNDPATFTLHSLLALAEFKLDNADIPGRLETRLNAIACAGYEAVRRRALTMIACQQADAKEALDAFLPWNLLADDERTPWLRINPSATRTRARVVVTVATGGREEIKSSQAVMTLDAALLEAGRLQLEMADMGLDIARVSLALVSP